MPEQTSTPNPPPVNTNWQQMFSLLRPHWKALSLALVAVIGETAADLLEPWPLKVIVDNLLQSKPLPHWLTAIISHTAGTEKYAILNFAVISVAVIAIFGAISSYTEKYLTTSVGQWVMHDLRRMGATNPLVERSRRPLKRATLMRMMEVYTERFSDPDDRIRATFEVVWLSGWAPHESQQKPLAPGSARQRLADVLGTRETKLPRDSDG